MWSFFSRDPTKDFPYEIGEAIPFESDRFFWKLHKGKKKGTGEEVTVFILDSKNASTAEIEASKAAIKRLKTLRHPNILTFFDSVESDKAIYLATEYVTPLEKYLQNNSQPNSDLSITWGLFQVTRALSFLINDGNMRHNNVHLGSVFVNAAGEWKLGGVEFVSGNDGSSVSVEGKIPPTLHQLDPPEVKKGSFEANKTSIDAWGLGVLIWEVFNGPLIQQASLKNANKIPKSLGSTFNELIMGTPMKRPNPSEVIAKGRKPGGFFKNDLVDSLLFLEEIQIKEQNEKGRFFNGLPTVLDKFPQDICRHKILPQLMNAFEFGNAGSSVLSSLFKLGKHLDETDYQSKIVPCIVKLFASTDRATRVRLLQQFEHFSDHLQPSTVNDKIFPNVVSGFMDTNPTVREQTIKAMLHLAPKLNFNNLNVELLKHFARLQIKDEQGGIRTNTTICLGKISSYLNPQTRRKVLIPAFTRVFQDTFPQARMAGILALAATQQYYLLSEVSTRILPALCTLTCDNDKGVRDNAFKTIKGFLGKLEKVSEDFTLKEKYEAEVDTSTPGIANSASSWAGWAVSALTSKFNRSQSQQPIGGQMGQPGVPAPPRSKGKYPFGGQSSSSTSTTTSSIPSTPSGERDCLQPTAEGQESTTDYDDDWDNEDWGSIDGEDNSTSKHANISFDAPPTNKENMGVTSGGSSSSYRPGGANDGWDAWPIEEKDEKDSFDESDFVPETRSDFNSTASINWSSNTTSHRAQEELFNSGSTKISPLKNHSNSTNTSDWGNDDWVENSEQNAPDSGDRQEEMRRRREERKLHRQHELQTKKSAKPGPMKLGARKI